MLYTVKDINETIQTIQTLKEKKFIKSLTIWFENDHVIEISKRNYKHNLYLFEPSTEHYYYQGEYKTLIKDLSKGYIKYGKKHKFQIMEVH